MATPYAIQITQGETFLLELRLKDEDRAPLDLSVAQDVFLTLPDWVNAEDFTIDTSAASEGGVVIRADRVQTERWPPSAIDMRVWVDWGPTFALEHEVIMHAVITVQEGL